MLLLNWKIRTVIWITHRLSSIRNANKINVIHKGTIAESGTYQELMGNKKQPGIFRQLAELQNMSWIWSGTWINIRAMCHKSCNMIYLSLYNKSDFLDSRSIHNCGNSYFVSCCYQYRIWNNWRRRIYQEQGIKLLTHNLQSWEMRQAKQLCLFVLLCALISCSATCVDKVRDGAEEVQFLCETSIEEYEGSRLWRTVSTPMPD